MVLNCVSVVNDFMKKEIIPRKIIGVEINNKNGCEKEERLATGGK